MKRKNNKVNYLTAERIARLAEVYAKNEWPRTRKIPFADEYDEFCEMLKFLEEEEQDLVIELTQYFLRIESGQYFSYFLMSLEKLFADTSLPTTSTVSIMPLISPSDFGKSKSSTALFYDIKSKIPMLPTKHKLKETKMVDAISPSTPANSSKITSIKNDLICLVDDFIGTGETAIDAVNHLLEKGLKQEYIVVVALVAQKQGMEALEQLGIRSYVAESRERGISDNPLFDNKKQEIMKNIEKKWV